MIKAMEPGHLRLAVLASGRGTNFDAICAAITRKDLDATIEIVVSDKPGAGVIEKAEQRGIKTLLASFGQFDSRDRYEEYIVGKLKENNIDLVVLAGYMRLVGPVFLDAFPNRVINIHPALLPAFKGLNAQKQALDYGVKYSGCTVHIVDRGMDSGPIIMQRAVPVYQDDDEDSLAARILAEEHDVYWRVLQCFCQGRVWIDGRKVYIK